MRLASCNALGTDDGLSEKKLKTVAKVAARNAEIIGFQEVKLLKDKELVLAGMGPQYSLECTQTNVPIGVDNSVWKVIESGFATLNPARKGLTPQRYVSWIIVEHRKRPRLAPVAFSNGHPINKGPKNKKWDTTPDDFEDRIRLAYHDQAMATWEEVVKMLRQERGLTQFGTGDFNRLKIPKFHPKQVWLDNKGIDKIFYVPGPKRLNAPRFDLRDYREIDTFSDHDLNVVYGHLIRP